MKFIKKTALLLAFTISLLSCEEFLDITPQGVKIPETQQDYRDLLLRGYNQVLNNRFFSSVRSDEYVLKESSVLEEIFTWDDFDNSSEAAQLNYRACYKVIFYANEVIKNKNEITDFESEQLNQLVAEAHLLRAYMYFYLVNDFADQYSADVLNKKAVPIVLGVDLEKEYTRNTIQEVYNLIVSDLEIGLQLANVAEQEKGFNYRFSKISAYGLAARVYQFMGDWEKALVNVNEALKINSQLLDFNNIGENPIPTHFESVENVLALEKIYHVEVNKSLFVSEKQIAAYNEIGDLRLPMFIDGEKVVFESSSINKTSMRTAEFYLIKAEALANLSQEAEAKSTLLELLKNRLTEDYYNEQATALKDLSGKELMQYIWDERFRELAFQGFRWYDLRRIGKPQLRHDFDGETFFLEENDPRYTLRFPKEAIENNPNLLN